MAGKDSDYRYHPKEPEAASKPKWVTLHREMFEEGTVGYDIFPEILEGRDRPETMFNQPVKSLWTGSTKAAFELEGREIATISQVMNMTQDEFKSLAKAGEIKYRIENHLKDQAITPHARLLASAFKKVQSPVPVEDERQIIDAVEKAISTLTDREIKVLSLKFGLVDGIIRSLEDTGRRFGEHYNPLTRTRIQQIESLALRKLSHRSGLREFKYFASSGDSEERIVRRTYGTVLSKAKEEELKRLAEIEERASLVRAKEGILLANVYETIEAAFNEGCIFSEEIQDWIVKNGRSIGFDPKGEITLALIEYAIGHPPREEEKIIRS